jgi:hypothetical protein
MSLAGQIPDRIEHRGLMVNDPFPYPVPTAAGRNPTPTQMAEASGKVWLRRSGRLKF